MPGVTVLDGNRFYVADSHGDATSGSEGLYADDVRVLSRWRLTVDGRQPRLLGAGSEGGPYTAVVHGQVVEPGTLGAPPVTTRRWLRVSRAGMQETLRLTNHGAGPVEVTVRYEFDADFADLYEVKDLELGEPSLLVLSSLPPLSESQAWLSEKQAWRLTGSTRAGASRSFAAGLQICFSKPGLYGQGETFFRVRLEARSEWTVQAAVLLLGADLDRPRPEPFAELGSALDLTRDRLIRWRASVPTLQTSWPDLAAAYRGSLSDLAALRTPAPAAGADEDDDLLPAAGLPWFMTVFGRDTLITCMQTLALGQDLPRAALRALARLQSTQDDPDRDAEPGKILHELRAGKVAALTQRFPYYGSVDSTPLFVMLAVETWRWTGDDGLLRELEPALRAALGWIEGADLTGRGYVEYHRRAAGGIENQCWKDSFNSILFSNGTRAEGPIACCEVQGYAYAARRGLAEVARAVWRDPDLADRLERDAVALAERFDRDFWVDTPRGGHYALALDRHGNQVDSLTSNIGHLLWTGIAAPSRVDRTAEALLGPELFSGWGVRTMSTEDAGYNPVEYHDGTVWPHDASLACLGLARVGRDTEAATLLHGLVEAASYVDWRLPEVLAGYARADTGFPVVYPTTCSPQAWAAAAPIAALTAVLGLAPDPVTGELVGHGSPPEDLDVMLRGVLARGRCWDVMARDGKVKVTRQ